MGSRGNDMASVVRGVIYGVVTGVGSDEFVGDSGDMIVGDSSTGGGSVDTGVVVGRECGKWGNSK